MEIIIPEKLKAGDTIGIVCPSAGLSPLAKHRFEQSKIMLERMGYKVLFGKHIINNEGYTSGSIEDRVSDLHKMFANTDVKMILTGTGGNHTNHILKYLDYKLIRKNPKIVIGSSDITVLHYALYAQAGLASFYGPCAAGQFGEYPEILKYTKDWFERLCVSDKVIYPINIEPSTEWTDEFLDWFQQLDRTRPRKTIKNPGYRWLQKGVAQGKALSGCILSMNRLAGTKYWIDPAGKILFLDILLSTGELDEALLDSFLTDLGNMGVFEKIVGLVIGRMYGCSDEAKEKIYKQIQFLTQKKYPIVTEFDIGHTDPTVTIRYDQLVELDGDSGVVKLLD
ncbi:MAG: S66 peptidase family protein [Bacteroidales bacterium]|jgi:muramoyltetrapeptide carboxypeptidase LdcA involved in peptidoglycan recycling